MNDQTKALVADNKAFFKEVGIKPGDTVYSVIRHVSASGMQRRINFYMWSPKSKRLLCLDYRFAKLAGYREHKSGGLVVNGGGMDMCFSVVYDFCRKQFAGQERAGYVFDSSTL